MAKSVQGRWGCNNDKAIQKRAHSSGKEDEAEACKILGWKNEVDKWREGWLTWLDHVQPVICRSRNYDITIAFLFRRELCQTCRYECSLVKNLPTPWETREENRKINKNILAP